MIGFGYEVDSGVALYPVVAPALIVVGALMIKGIRFIDWNDPTESIPTFLTIVMMPLTISITEGISFGFISSALLKFASGRTAETHWIVFVCAVLFLIRSLALV